VGNRRVKLYPGVSADTFRAADLQPLAQEMMIGHASASLPAGDAILESTFKLRVGLASRWGLNYIDLVRVRPDLHGDAIVLRGAAVWRFKLQLAPVPLARQQSVILDDCAL
jgi:hypothetical protein